jgi:hypothetical protein
MRTWLYDLLISDEALQAELGGVEDIKQRVVPRYSETTINLPKPFLIYGLGNSTDEGLVDDTDLEEPEAERQFFQVWVHDEGGTFSLVDDLVEKVKDRLRGASSAQHKVTVVRYLETSSEFSNITYNTIFRYIRFQAIRAQGGTSS